ncbi:unnamed protein product [Phytomonas sp. EM1]|nr:unnamed protein product [Phytomonas sp. EM1]|eukprot:CCW64529.1 unnamed protein product [Phytomonas sp. isolate EM1]
MHVLLVYLFILIGAAVITRLAFGEDSHRRIAEGCGLDLFLAGDAKDAVSVEATTKDAEGGPLAGEVPPLSPEKSFQEGSLASFASSKGVPPAQCWMLRFLEETCCALPVRASDVRVLHHPTAFYDEMRSQIRAARRSIVLSALYLSHGPLSQAFVECLEEKFREMLELWERTQSSGGDGDEVAERGEPFTITVLMDYNRMHSRRDLATVRRLLSMADVGSGRASAFPHAPASTRPQVQLFLYQSPCRWNRVFAPFGRAKEALGVQHTKIFCFDGQHTLLTGANLSDDYFATRIDRYVAFDANVHIAEWFTRLVRVLCALSHPVERGVDPAEAGGSPSFPSPSTSSPSSLSSPLHTRCGLVVRPNATGFDPSAQPGAFAQAAGARLRAFARGVGRDFAGLAYTALTSPEAGCDTLLFPTLQCGRAGVFHDSAVVKSLLGMTSPTDHVFLTSPYLNLHAEFVEEFLHREIRLDCITASVKTNGWNGQRGIAGFIPFFYLQLERSFYYLMKAYHCVHRVHLHEFSMPGLTFHAKGVWFVSEPAKGENGSPPPAGLRDIPTPYLTAYGSTNYGYRSVFKDLEAEGFLFTFNQSLRESIKEELHSLLQHSTAVPEAQFVGEAMGRFQPVISLLAQMGQYFL